MGRKRKYGYFTVILDAGAALSDATAEVEALFDEMESWADKLELSAGLSQTEKFGEVDAAREGLDEGKEYLSDVDEQVISVNLNEISYRDLRHRKTPRHARLKNAVSILEAVVTGLEEVQGGIDLDDPYDHGLEAKENLAEQLDEQMGYIADAISALENVDFPGMY